MKEKHTFSAYKNKWTRIWKKGAIQKTSRVTYDVVWNVILFTVVLLCVGGFFAVGIGAGYFASLVKDEPIRSHESMASAIYDYEETSRIYFANNKLIGEIRSDIQRDEIHLDDVSPLLIDAVIATEDEYFNEHNGVVPKAIVRAVVQEAVNSSSKSGGSTLTQQLIKNQVLTDEVSFERKAKEILLALRLETFLDKDDILEAYLNVIPYGRNAAGINIAGVQTAAKGVFNVDASELTLPQAAYLAGLPQSPSAYTPFQNTGELKSEEGLQAGLNRMQTVLRRMVDGEFITQEEYEEASNYDITQDFRGKMNRPIDNYPLLSAEIEEQAKMILQSQLAEQDGYTEEDLDNDEELRTQYYQLADDNIRKSGYNIHSTINKEMYDVMQDVAKDYAHYGPDQANRKGVVEPIQMGAVLLENSSGKVLSFVGNREFSRGENENNYAFGTRRQSGSTMKPILPYAAAMELGQLQPGGPVADIPIKVGLEGHVPSNYSNRYYGLVSAREALEQSYNVSAFQVYDRVIDQDPVSQFGLKMGIPFQPDHHDIPSAAIGVTDLSVAENASAFTTLANDGKHAEMYMIEKITAQDGEVVYEHEQKATEVYSPQTAYLTIDLMRGVLTAGTARFLPGQLKYGGVDWAGKTGTTDDYSDAWFVASNPNVTMATWQGYNDRETSVNYCPGCSYSYSQRNLLMWAQLMNAATEIDPDLLAPQERFSRPDGIVERSYCAISGMLPSDLCQKAGLVYTDLFNAKFVPTEVDDSLITGSYVLVDGKAVVAGPNTPSEFVQGDGLAFNPAFLKRHGYDQLSDLTQLFPNRNRESWEKIGLPGQALGDSIDDDGSAPSAPSSLSASSSSLTWGASSNHIVGYYIYQASDPDGDFKRIGSSAETSFSISGGNAVYRVIAVDYFGRTSSPSNEVIVGSFDEPEEEEEEKQEEKQEENDENKDEENEEDEEDIKPPVDPDVSDDDDDTNDNNGNGNNGNGNNGNGNNGNGNNGNGNN